MTIGNDRVLQERETDLLKFELKKDGAWYVLNAWGRHSKRGKWMPVWNDRTYISYLKSLNDYNDTGAALTDWKNQLNVQRMAA